MPTYNVIVSQYVEVAFEVLAKNDTEAKSRALAIAACEAGSAPQVITNAEVVSCERL